MKEFIKKYGIYILLLFCLIFGLLSLIYRNATLDDDLYLFETAIMTEALSTGEWIGNYSVGTHGFLFKLPVALIFLLTGPSLAIATVWNVLLACFALYVFYLVLKKYFKKESIALLGTFLLLTNFQFMLHVPTYMRETPALLALLILLYFLKEKKSYWLIGLSLLLIFDAKEYIWFMIVPGLCIYVLWRDYKGNIFRSVWEYVKSYFMIFIPTILFVLLMIFTQIVPVNMFSLSIIPGVTKGGIQYHIKHFDVELSTTNRIDDEALTIQQVPSKQASSFERVWNVLKSYAGKLLYPRTFSFLSIPKVIVFPALITSLLFLKKAFKKKDNYYISSFLILWSFMTIFILRASFDRYLLPIVPVVLFFLILFVKDLVEKKKEFLLVILFSSVMAFTGLLFEIDYIFTKIILNTVFVSLYLLYLFYKERIKDLDRYLLFILGCVTFCVVAFFFYANGQLRYYILWGRDYEVKEVVSYFKQDERVILNDVGWDILPRVYRGDNRYNPEWKWEFEDWVPRKKYLKQFEKETTYMLFSKTVEQDREVISSMNIQKLGLMVSELEQYSFLHQEKLEEYIQVSWLELEEVVELKNKIFYIFNVINNE